MRIWTPAPIYAHTPQLSTCALGLHADPFDRRRRRAQLRVELAARGAALPEPAKKKKCGALRARIRIRDRGCAKIAARSVHKPNNRAFGKNVDGLGRDFHDVRLRAAAAAARGDVAAAVAVVGKVHVPLEDFAAIAFRVHARVRVELLVRNARLFRVVDLSR